MQHDTYRNDAASAHPTDRDFAEAVPRGNILRSTDPVVAPVVSPPTDAPTNAGPLDASSRRVIDDPDAPERPTGARRIFGLPGGRFSLGATFLGWAVASFFGIVFTVILFSLLGAAAMDETGQAGLDAGEVQTFGILGFIGILVATFLAYLVGGYAAGRIAHWNGGKHGALVPVWTILFSLLGILFGATLGAGADVFGIGVAGADAGELTALGILGALLTLAVMFGGAILGGILGARHDQRYEGDLVERRATRAGRGRPL